MFVTRATLIVLAYFVLLLLSTVLVWLSVPKHTWKNYSPKWFIMCWCGY